jgi:DNA mismatch endonuclease (patch repair protein)
MPEEAERSSIEESLDPFTDEKRRAIMQAVRGKGTKPELRVRKAAHRLGYRFRLHRKDLPGKPDLVFPSRRLCLFVHGCFWHRHSGCKKSSIPETNKDFWLEKFGKNVGRDAHVRMELEKMGWRVVVIWECETNSPEQLERTLKAILQGL